MLITGTAGQPTPAGVPVAVSKWFVGAGAAPVVFITVSEVMESSCGTSAPAGGHDFLFLLWRDDAGRLILNSCSVAADLATDDGRARLAQAEALFGPGGRPQPTSAPPTVVAPQPAGILESVVPFVGVVLFGLAFLVGIVGALRRTDRRRGDPPG